VNLQELENYKIRPEILKHGDNKIFDIIDRNTASAFFHVTKPTKACITFHQPQKRFIKDAQDTFEVPCGVIFVFKYQELEVNDSYLKIESLYDRKRREKLSKSNNNSNNVNNKGKYNLISSNFHNFEKLFVEINLEELGEYHVLCISQFENFDLKFNLVISTYAEFPLELYYLKRKDVVSNWLLYCLKDLSFKNGCYTYFDPNEKESFYINYTNHKSNSTGFGMLYYENNSTSSNLKVRVALNNSSTFRVLNCQRLNLDSFNTNKASSTNNYAFTVPKSSYKCLLLQFTQTMPLFKQNMRFCLSIRLKNL
jgi:hypothetical protein